MSEHTNRQAPTTTKAIREALAGVADTVTFRDGEWTARRSFFYTNGCHAEHFEARVRECVPHATILESGEVWKPFRGGASVAQGSHWFVRFTTPAPEPVRPVTVQFEMTTARRGHLTTTVKERTFRSAAALLRFEEQHAGNVRILRYLSERDEQAASGASSQE